MTQQQTKEREEVHQQAGDPPLDIRRYRLQSKLVTTPDGPLWRVELPDIPGSVAYAEHEDEASKSARANALHMIEHAQKIGMPPPVSNDEYGPPTNVKVRVLPEVHFQLDRLSMLLGVSFNETVLQIIEDELANARTSYLSPRSETLLAIAYDHFDSIVNVTWADAKQHKSGHWIQRVPRGLHWRLWVQSKYSKQPISKTTSSTLESAMTRMVDHLRRMKREGHEPAPVHHLQGPRVPPRRPRAKVRSRPSHG